MWRRHFVIVAVSLLLAGCGGGGGGSSLSPAASQVPNGGGSSSTPATSTGAGSPVAPSTNPPSGGSKATQQITIHLKIDPSATTSSAKRRVKYVSPATDGVLVQVYTSPESANPTPIGVSATDVSPGSAACAGATGARTCTIYIPAPAGTDDFVFTTYDQPPVAGTTTFASSANVLSIGEVTQTINLGGTNTVNAALGGVIASLAAIPLSQSALPGSAFSYTLAITGFDADGNAIVAGAADPYNTPITASVTETGGSGNTLLSLAGGANATSESITQSSQPLTVLYNGSGAAGYGAQITISAANATPLNAAFGPFFVTATSPWYANGAITFNQTGEAVVINLSEYGFNGIFSATPGPSCAGVASVTAPPLGGTTSAVVTSGPNNGACSITFSDGNVSVPVTVTNAYTTATITIPGINVSGLNTSYTTLNQAEIYWDPIPLITTYDIFLNGNYVGATTNGQTYFAFSGLAPQTTYTAGVAARLSNGLDGTPSTTTFTTASYSGTYVEYSYYNGELYYLYQGSVSNVVDTYYITGLTLNLYASGYVNGSYNLTGYGQCGIFCGYGSFTVFNGGSLSGSWSNAYGGSVQASGTASFPDVCSNCTITLNGSIYDRGSLSVNLQIPGLCCSYLELYAPSTATLSVARNQTGTDAKIRLNPQALSPSPSGLGVMEAPAVQQPTPPPPAILPLHR